MTVRMRFAPMDGSRQDVSLREIFRTGTSQPWWLCCQLYVTIYYVIYIIRIYIYFQLFSLFHANIKFWLTNVHALHVVLHGRKIYFQINPIQLWLNSLGSILLNAYIIYLLIKNANQECNLIDILDRQIFWFYLCLTYTFISWQ